MSTYYIVNEVGMELGETKVDSNHTLIELANVTYDDIDSFWIFLFANKAINPFELLQISNTNLKNSVIDLTGLGLLVENTSNDALFTNGSLLLPATPNSGNTWDYGRTGNFSLTGGFALIDSYNPFSKRATVKYAKGFTLGLTTQTGTTFSGLIKGKTAYSLYDQSTEIQTLDAELSVTSNIDYLTSEEEVYLSVKSEYPVFAKGGANPAYKPVTTATEAIEVETNIEEVIDTRLPKIKSYLPGTVKQSNFIKIVQNYEDI
jgi:hypothetical protein